MKRKELRTLRSLKHPGKGNEHMVKKGNIAVQAEIKSVRMNPSSYGPAKVVVSIEFEQAKPRPIESFAKWRKDLRDWDVDVEALDAAKAGTATAPKKGRGKKAVNDAGAEPTPLIDATLIASLEAKIQARYDVYAGKANRENGKAVAGAQGFMMLSLLQGQKANVVISPVQQVLLGFGGLMLEAPGDPEDDGFDDDDDGSAD